MSTQVYLDGQLADHNDARISVFDSIVAHGVGLFETMRAYNGVVFRLEHHLRRLTNSAAALHMHAIEEKRMSKAVHELLAANDLTDARVRLTVTGGTVRNPREARGQPSLLITADAMSGYPDEFYEKGMLVTVTDYRQWSKDPLAGHKTTCYLPRLLALQRAQQAGAGEALWFNDTNRLAEGCISNVFLVKDGRLCTPPLNTPVLPGITRATVIELAGQLGIDVEQRELIIDDVLGADEIFLTNSSMQVLAVCQVEQHTVGTGCPGPVTQQLLDSYRSLVQAV